MLKLSQDLVALIQLGGFTVTKIVNYVVELEKSISLETSSHV